MLRIEQYTKKYMTKLLNRNNSATSIIKKIDNVERRVKEIEENIDFCNHNISNIGLRISNIENDNLLLKGERQYEIRSLNLSLKENLKKKDALYNDLFSAKKDRRSLKYLQKYLINSTKLQVRDTTNISRILRDTSNISNDDKITMFRFDGDKINISIEKIKSKLKNEYNNGLIFIISTGLNSDQYEYAKKELSTIGIHINENENKGVIYEQINI